MSEWEVDGERRGEVWGGMGVVGWAGGTKMVSVTALRSAQPSD